MNDMSLTLGPIALPTLLRFTATALLIELTPGPNMGYLAIVAAQRGRSAGLTVIAGVTLGLTLYLAATVAGVAQGFLDNRYVYETLRWSGVVYMVWLPKDAWHPEPMTNAHELPLQRTRLFARGLLANLLNVKAAILYAVLLPAFLDGKRGSLPLQALTLGSVHLVIATTVHCSIVMLAARSRILVTNHTSEWLGRTYAVALLAVAGWLAWSTRVSA
jgi:threonine/homoserine/homoserine lactone efflux protein